MLSSVKVCTRNLANKVMPMDLKVSHGGVISFNSRGIVSDWSGASQQIGKLWVNIHSSTDMNHPSHIDAVTKENPEENERGSKQKGNRQRSKREHSHKGGIKERTNERTKKVDNYQGRRIPTANSHSLLNNSPHVITK